MAPPAIVDYYAQLEVERGADEATVKKSYRKLVLKYHPDKNPEDRDAAEEKIRIINSAYETLSNPAKRAAYDQQLKAMEMRSQGLRVDTSRIQPRMSIPKAFMLCPMGHPDKFLRTMGRSLGFHSRADVSEVEFDEFFKVARFTLWWLPEVNNMCRLRTQPSQGIGVMPEVMGKGKKKGPPVGQIISFGLSQQCAASDVMVSDIEQPMCCNIIAVASPDFPGAFRFESAFFPGHFLTFEPPTGIQMMAPSQYSVFDYMLMDFGVCEKFKTLDEALLPSVLSLGGDKQPVQLARVCQDSRVQAYFKLSMGGVSWDYNDFSLYFHAHSDRWEYDANQLLLRLRGPEEKLIHTLGRAKTPEEAISRLNSVQQQLQWLPLDVCQRALQLLSKPISDVATTMPGACTGESHKTASVKVLTVVRDMCISRRQVSFDGLIPLWSLIADHPNADIQQLRSETLQALGQCVSTLLIDADASSIGLESLDALLSMPLDWETCGSVVAQKAQQAIAKLSLEEMTPLIQKAGRANAYKLGESLATSAMMKTLGAQPETAVEALDAMVAGRFLLDGAAMTLRRLLETVSSFESSVRVVIGLIEQNVSFSDLDACWEYLVNKAALESLPASLFIRLAAAVTKSGDLHSTKFGALGHAARAILANDTWSIDDATELLLAVANKGSATSSTADRDALLECGIEFLRPKLEQCSPTNLSKIIKGISGVKACRPLLEATAVHLASKFSEIAPAQLLSLTKVLLPLGSADAVFQQVVDLWKKRLTDDAAKTISACDKAEITLNPGDLVRISGLTSDAGSRMNNHSGHVTRFIEDKGRYEVRLTGGFSSGEVVSLNPKNLKKDRPKFRQMSQGLSPNQLAELAHLMAVVDPDHGIFTAIAENLVEQMEALTPDGSALLEAALRAGSGGAKFRRQVRRDRDSSRSRGRERDCSRSRGKEKGRSRDRSRSHGKERGRSQNRGRDRNRSRSRERERVRSRSRGRARNRSRSREKERGRSRSRGRARDRSRSRGRRR